MAQQKSVKMFRLNLVYISLGLPYQEKPLQGSSMLSHLHRLPMRDQHPREHPGRLMKGEEMELTRASGVTQKAGSLWKLSHPGEKSNTLQ
jgi:hypothetical protein